MHADSRCFDGVLDSVFAKIPFLTVRRAKKAEKRDSHAKKIILSFLPRFPKLS